MIFIRRSRRPVRRYTVLRVSLFFFAAGLWLAGVAVDNPAITGTAIVVAAVALLAGLIARRAGNEGEGDAGEPRENG
jgi:di/tricarboxylate transporter